MAYVHSFDNTDQVAGDVPQPPKDQPAESVASSASPTLYRFLCLYVLPAIVAIAVLSAGSYAWLDAGVFDVCMLLVWAVIICFSLHRIFTLVDNNLKVYADPPKLVMIVAVPIPRNRQQDRLLKWLTFVIPLPLLLLVHVEALGARDYVLPLILAIVTIPQILERNEKKLRIFPFAWKLMASLSAMALLVGSILIFSPGFQDTDEKPVEPDSESWFDQIKWLSETYAFGSVYTQPIFFKFALVPLAMLERFDRGHTVDARNWQLLSEQPDRDHEKEDKPSIRSPLELRYGIPPGFYTTQPRPTFHSALLGGILGTGVGMSIVNEVKAGFLWLYFGCAGIAIGAAISLTIQGKWRDLFQYEETWGINPEKDINKRIYQ